MSTDSFTHSIEHKLDIAVAEIAELQEAIRQKEQEIAARKDLATKLEAENVAVHAENAALKSWQESIKPAVYRAQKLVPFEERWFYTEGMAEKLGYTVTATYALIPQPTPSCPMGEWACADKSQCFEPCGDLGHSEEHAVVAQPLGGEQRQPIEGWLTVPRGHFWRGSVDPFICKNCGKHHDAHIHTDEASRCPDVKLGGSES